MGLVGNIIALIVLIGSPLVIFLLYGNARRKISANPATTPIEISNRNLDIKDAKEKYTNLLQKIALPVLIIANILTIGESLMDEKDKKISQLSADYSALKTDHEKRIKDIEDYLFPPGGPSGPAVFQRIEKLENSRKDLEQLMLRVTAPDPELVKKVHELEGQITLLKAELIQMQKRLAPVQRGMPG